MVLIQRSRWSSRRNLPYFVWTKVAIIISGSAGIIMIPWMHWLWDPATRKPPSSTHISPMHSYTLGDDKDDEEAFMYAQRFRQLDRKLTFFHIPKTAGTAIEFAAGSRKISWGSCLFRHKPKRTICKYPEGEDWPRNIGWWHLPRFLFPLANTDPYQNTELFGVIRNPYERMVSEFYYVCTLQPFDWRPSQCDTTKLFDSEYMNEWIRSKFHERDRNSSLAYLMDNGHFTAQYEFVFGPHQVRMLDFVLRMDDSAFTTNFARLVNAFGLADIRLKKINAIGAAKRDSEAFLQVGDFDNQTKNWIRAEYAQDFEFGDYQEDLEH